MNVWQDIATAPKDGTRVELADEDNGLQDVGYWDDYTNRSWHQEGDMEGEWSTDIGNGDMTHWRHPQP